MFYPYAYDDAPSSAELQYDEDLDTWDRQTCDACGFPRVGCNCPDEECDCEDAWEALRIPYPKGWDN